MALMATNCAARRPPSCQVSSPVRPTVAPCARKRRFELQWGQCRKGFRRCGPEERRGRLVDVAPCEPAAAHEKVHFIAKVAVAEMNAHNEDRK